ncbi:S9 family peptidase [Sphingopyxis sp. C-1]|uniref:S9 family peptidase n=1 Tax=Sphingopyxis sp. C-1 TaxID=262667 RepID=UPI001EE6A5E8|nr:S9 family peptidase [Sphingopyxis sp. C-1]
MLLALGVSAPALGISQQSRSPGPDIQQVGAARLEHLPLITEADLEAAREYESLRGVSLLDWFDDGSLLIHARDGAVNQLFRLAAPKGMRQQLTTAADPPVIGFPLAGGGFAYIRDAAGDEWYEVLLAGIGAAPLRISEPDTRNLLTAVSPDRRHVAWASVARGSAEHTVVVVDASKLDTQKRVYKDVGSAFPAAFSNDGNRLIVSRQIAPTERSMVLVDLVTGTATPLAGEQGAMLRDPQFLPDDQSIIYVSDAGSDAMRLVSLDLRSGKQRDLTRRSGWNVELFDLAPDGRSVAYTVNADGYSELYLIDLASGRVHRGPKLPRGVISSLRYSPDGSRIAFGLATATSPGDVWVLKLAGRKLERWTMPGSEIASTDGFIEPKLIRFRSFDGLQIPAFLYRPEAAEANVRLPVIIDFHGGPEDQARPVYRRDLQYYARSLGAAVIQPNVRGSAGYGKRFMSLDNGSKREDAVRDVGALLDWIASQSDLDPKRVIVSGGSYGGYLTLASLIHYPDRLAGGADAYGVSNFITFLESTAEYRRALRRPEYGDERDAEMRKFLQAISPLTNVELMQKPLLVMQGANDPRVPRSESDQIVSALRARGIHAPYILFEDEGHGFRKEANQALHIAAQAAFMAKLFSTVHDGAR